jgi:hypothetical protein
VHTPAISVLIHGDCHFNFCHLVEFGTLGVGQYGKWHGDHAVVDQREQAGAGVRRRRALQRHHLTRHNSVAGKELPPGLDFRQQVRVAVRTRVEDDRIGIAETFHPIQKKMTHNNIPHVGSGSIDPDWQARQNYNRDANPPMPQWSATCATPSGDDQMARLRVITESKER